MDGINPATLRPIRKSNIKTQEYLWKTYSIWWCGRCQHRYNLSLFNTTGHRSLWNISQSRMPSDGRLPAPMSRTIGISTHPKHESYWWRYLPNPGWIWHCSINNRNDYAKTFCIGLSAVLMWVIRFPEHLGMIFSFLDVQCKCSSADRSSTKNNIMQQWVFFSFLSVEWQSVRGWLRNTENGLES